MKKFLPVFFIVIVFAFRAFSQSPSPTPPVEEDRDVVKITTNLIQVDVTVTDSKGRIVTDLKPEEIEIYENDEKQDITNFSFINVEAKTLDKYSVAKKPEKNAPPPVPAPPVNLKPEQVQRTIALIVDDLSLSFQSAYYVRRALRKFVDEQMQPNDLVAIMRSGKGIGALQQFTSDKRQLYAAIERVKWNPAGKGGMAGIDPIESGSISSSGSARDQTEAEAELNQFREDLFSVGTLGAVNYVVRGMRNLPGRKSIILFSDGIELTSQNGDNYRVMNALRQLADLANRAAVVIYTLDARGLQALGLTAADDVSGLSSSQIENLLSDRRNSFYDSQAGLGYLAKVTGGMVIKNNNDLSGGVREILNDQTGYYLVGYQPDEATFDPVKRRFNKLTVKVKRPGLKVRYRSGFFGITDDKVKFVAKTPRDQIVNALISPFATGELTVKLTPVFANDAKNGSYISSMIHVEASDLKFIEEADDWKKAVFDIVVIALGDNGLLVDQLARTETIRLKGELYKKIMQNGFVYTVPFPMKKPGAYQLRVALRDAETSKIGSANQFVEVPDVKKDRLVLSDIIFQNVEKVNKGGGEVVADDSNSNLKQDTAQREFKSGSALIYNLVIFNSRIDKATGQPQLKTQVKIFQNEKEIFTGKENAYKPDNATDLKRLPFTGGVELGTALPPGEYVLQIIVTDTPLAKEKRRVQTKWLDFEIVK
jgi:VWFA-related protein